MKSLAFIVFILFSACAPKLSVQVDKLNQQQNTVARLVDLNYQPLRLDEEIKINVDEETPVYLFSTGRSYVKAFSLPEERPLKIIIKSYFIGPFVDESVVFIPCAMLLSRDDQVISSIDQELPIIEKASLTETGGVRFKNTLSICVTESDSVANFVIYTTDRHLSQTSDAYINDMTQAIIPGVTVITVPIGKHNVKVPHSPVGRLRIIVQRLNP